MAPIRTIEEFYAAAGQLIDAWCEERRLGPLSMLLPAYLDPNNLTDGWHGKYAALKNLRAFCRDGLSDAELETVNELIRFAERIVYRD